MNPGPVKLTRGQELVERFWSSLPASVQRERVEWSKLAQAIDAELNAVIVPPPKTRGQEVAAAMFHPDPNDPRLLVVRPVERGCGPFLFRIEPPGSVHDVLIVLREYVAQAIDTERASTACGAPPGVFDTTFQGYLHRQMRAVADAIGVEPGQSVTDWGAAVRHAIEKAAGPPPKER